MKAMHLALFDELAIERHLLFAQRLPQVFVERREQPGTIGSFGLL